MSRIGKLPITVPNGVTIEATKEMVKIKGPKGELKMKLHPLMTVEAKEGKIFVTRKSDENLDKALHGTTRTLLANMIQGVTQGYEKKLEIQGVGYRAAIQGKKLVLSLGYSHPVEYSAPQGVTVAVDPEKKNILSVTGNDKQLVGEVAAKIRSFREPEPYKGKGIRYLGEHVQRKAGKAAAGAKTG